MPGNRNNCAFCIGKPAHFNSFFYGPFFSVAEISRAQPNLALMISLLFWDFYPKAFWRAVAAEVCVCVVVVAFIFLLNWSATRQSHETTHPRETPPPVMKN
jgi:hypothetical protein